MTLLCAHELLLHRGLRCLLVNDALGVLSARGLRIRHKLSILRLSCLLSVASILHVCFKLARNLIHEGQNSSSLLGLLLHPTAECLRWWRWCPAWRRSSAARASPGSTTS